MVTTVAAPPPPRIPRLGDASLQHEFHRILAHQVAVIGQGRFRLRVPEPVHLMQRLPGLHFHFRPELFVQVRGSTRFRFPAGELLLPEGEAALLPTGLPHGEVCLPADDGAAFRNFVVGFYASTVSMHFAVETESGKPDIEVISFFATPDLRRLIDLADALIQARHTATPHREDVVRGLALALFSQLADLVAVETPPAHGDSERIFQIKWLARDQLYNPDLSVAFMAKRLHCSADHLSHIFHRETGETLTHYIQRQRMLGAMRTLAQPGLTVSEIAWACGFTDAGYFTRVFRKHTGLTPVAYRRRLESERHAAEVQPMTVFHDAEDYGGSQPRWSSHAGER